MKGGAHMARNELAFSKEAAELIDKALKHYIVTVLDKNSTATEEDALAEELHEAFKAMYK